MTDLWLNKWIPSSTKEIIGNSNNINQVKNLIQNLENSKCKSLIISGKRGIGKTTAIKLLLKEMNYNFKIIYPDEIKDYRIENDFFDFYNYKNSIYSKINLVNNSCNKLAIIFDDIESITLTTEKKFILSILKENNKRFEFPLIFISNNDHSKLLNDLKKHIIEITFQVPEKEEIIKLIKSIFLKENIKYDSDECLEKIIEFSQYDIRRLLNILQDISLNFTSLNNNIIDTFINKSLHKITNYGLFDSTIDIINNYKNYYDIFKYYENEKVLLPLMIHENYQKKLEKNKNEKYCLDLILKISDSLSKGDNIETSIYTNQNWFLQELHAFFTCIIPSYLLNKDNLEVLSKDNIKFSSDLNKTSLKNINRKNINNLSKIIPNKDIDNILFLNKISNHYISNNLESNLINILKNYDSNISIKDIELCLKIDKTVEFNKICNKLKKNINNKLVVI